MTKTTAKRQKKLASPSTVTRWVPLSALIVKPTVQRPLDESRAQAMADAMDLSLLSVIDVSDLGDDKYHVTNGFARTETAVWFDLVWGKATGVLFLRGRVSFHYANGKRAKANSGAPSALIAYGQADADVLAEHPVAGHYVPIAPKEQSS